MCGDAVSKEVGKDVFMMMISDYAPTMLLLLLIFVFFSFDVAFLFF